MYPGFPTRNSQESSFPIAFFSRFRIAFSLFSRFFFTLVFFFRFLFDLLLASPPFSLRLSSLPPLLSVSPYLPSLSTTPLPSYSLSYLHFSSFFSSSSRSLSSLVFLLFRFSPLLQLFSSSLYAFFSFILIASPPTFSRQMTRGWGKHTLHTSTRKHARTHRLGRIPTRTTTRARRDAQHATAWMDA